MLSPVETLREFGGHPTAMKVRGNTEPSANRAVSGWRRCDGQGVRWHTNTRPTSAQLATEQEDMTCTTEESVEARDKIPSDNNIGKWYYQSVVIPMTDLLMNAGRPQVINLVKAKEEIAMMSLLQKVSRAVYGTAPNNTSIDLDNIPAILASSGSYATITISGQWQCNGGNGPSSGGAVGIANMQTDYGNATYGNEEPDTIITTQSGWNAFWAILAALQRYINWCSEAWHWLGFVRMWAKSGDLLCPAL